MTNHELNFDSERESVEQKWIVLLNEHGLSEHKAENIVSGLETHPKVRRRTPGPEEVRKYLGKAVRNHPFDTYEQLDDPDAVRRAMIEVLDEGIDGERPGPLPLKREKRFQLPEPDGVSIDEEAFDSMTPSAEPVPAFKFEAGGANAEDIDQLKADLQQLEDETDLTLDEVASFVESCYESGHDQVVSLLVNSRVHLNALEVALDELNVTGDAEN